MDYGMFNASIGVGQVSNGIAAAGEEISAAHTSSWRGSAADSFHEALQGARFHADRALELAGTLQWNLTQAQNTAATELLER